MRLKLKSRCLRVIRITVSCLLIAAIVCICLWWPSNRGKHNKYEEFIFAARGYLLSNPSYRIPDYSPVEPDSLSVLPPPVVLNCSKGLKPLTVIKHLKEPPCLHEVVDAAQRHNDSTSKFPLPHGCLIYLPDREPRFHPKGSIFCCYRPFRRRTVQPSQRDDFDDLVREKADCKQITSYITLMYHKMFTVFCQDASSFIYMDIHAFVPIQLQDLPLELNAFSRVPPNLSRLADEANLNVAILGLDSVSRLNVRRYLPLTYRKLQEMDAIQLMGFNRVGLNTFPNLVPMLAGIPPEDLVIRYPEDIQYSPLDDFPFVWKKFASKGYKTVYGEDDVVYSTFNFKKLGFAQQPTDVYLRPLMQMAELYLKDNNKCYGLYTSADVLINYLKNFVQCVTHYSWFVLMWSNTLSHNNLHLISTVDKRITEFLTSYDEQLWSNNTFLFFISDHGLRFGDFRETPQGRFEESLPAAFILLPEWFKNRYPRATVNLLLNQNRLTTPYDVHETLLDILNLKFDHQHKTEIMNEKGISLFKLIPKHRTCGDAGIPINFCAGMNTIEISTTHEHVNTAAILAFSKVNTMLAKHPQCVQYDDIKVLSAFRHALHWKETSVKTPVHLVTIQFELRPGSVKLEGTVKLGTELELVGQLSRINRYGNTSDCVVDNYLLTLCYCRHSLGL